MDRVSFATIPPGPRAPHPNRDGGRGSCTGRLPGKAEAIPVSVPEEKEEPPASEAEAPAADGNDSDAGGASGVTVIEPQQGWVRLDLPELWRYRELLYFLVWRDVKVRYKQTALGALWALIQPFMTMIVFTLIFKTVANMSTADLPGPIFYFTGLLPWMFFASAVTNGSGALVGSQNLISKVYFPRLIVPLASTFVPMVDLAVQFVLLAALMVWYQVPPAVAILALPLILLFVWMSAFAVSLWLSALNVYYRDVRYVVPFLVNFGMFASPVIYATKDTIPTAWRMWYGLNPMAGAIEGFRWAVTGHGMAPGPLMLISGTVVLAVLLGGLAYFRRMEGTFADVI